MVCYAYFSDVTSAVEFNWKTELEYIGELPRWFKRGFTLQELIAPLSVKFYTRDWRYIGTKKDKSMRISNITGIDRAVLRNERSPQQLPVAETMYWASSRRTTRAEDLAYCLMGLFDVNMPLLYGEGTKAFDRLQEQILRTTNDDTLFLWQMRSTREYSGWLSEGHFGTHLHTSRMLASNPSDFDRRADQFLPQPNMLFCEPQLMPRQLGLRMTLPMRRIGSADISRFEFPSMFEEFLGRLFIAALGCLRKDDETHHSQLAILLEASVNVSSPEKQVFRRVPSLYCYFPLLEVSCWETTHVSWPVIRRFPLKRAASIS